MSDKPIISVENLSKRYYLHDDAGDTLRESLGKQLRHIGQRLTGKAPAPQPVEHGAFWALKDVSFDVMPGESVGIMGVNGSGKSTLIKILSRISEPTTGKATLRGTYNSILEVGAGLHRELSGLENIRLYSAIIGMKQAEVARKLDAIIDFADIGRFLTMPLKSYSTGMRIRLAFAISAHVDTDILMLDEALAVGDTAFQEKCLKRMHWLSEQGQTILFVSHSLGQLAQFCSRGLFLQQGQLIVDGSITDAIESYCDSFCPPRNTDFTGVLYDAAASAPIERVTVTRVTVMDPETGALKSKLHTGDGLVFCIEGVAPPALSPHRINLDIYERTGVQLLLSLSSPLEAQIFDTDQPAFSMWCTVPQLPLASGDYLVQVGVENCYGLPLWGPRKLSWLTIQPQAGEHTQERGGTPLRIPHHWRAETPMVSA